MDCGIAKTGSAQHDTHNYHSETWPEPNRFPEVYRHYYSRASDDFAEHAHRSLPARFGVKFWRPNRAYRGRCLPPMAAQFMHHHVSGADPRNSIPDDEQYRRHWSDFLWPID